VTCVDANVGIWVQVVLTLPDGRVVHRVVVAANFAEALAMFEPVRWKA